MLMSEKSKAFGLGCSNFIYFFNAFAFQLCQKNFTPFYRNLETMFSEWRSLLCRLVELWMWILTNVFEWHWFMVFIDHHVLFSQILVL